MTTLQTVTSLAKAPRLTASFLETFQPPTDNAPVERVYTPIKDSNASIEDSDVPEADVARYSFEAWGVPLSSKTPDCYCWSDADTLHVEGGKSRGLTFPCYKAHHPTETARAAARVAAEILRPEGGPAGLDAVIEALAYMVSKSTEFNPKTAMEDVMWQFDDIAADLGRTTEGYPPLCYELWAARSPESKDLICCRIVDELAVGVW
jgi:hypothetical protein